MPKVDRINQMSIEDLSPMGKARVVHHLQRALALMDEGQESMQIALEGFESDATAQLAAVDDALDGQVPLTDLTVEQRRLFNQHVDEAVRERLSEGDYVQELLTDGITVVVLDGDDLFEIKPDGSRNRLS